MQNEQMQGGSAGSDEEKGRAPYVIGGIIVIALALLGWVFLSGDDDEARMKQAAEDKKMATVKEERAVREVETSGEKSGGAMTEKKAGSYETYDASKLAMAKEGKVVLFFRASWCPTCRALDADIRENLSDIPSGVTILDVDYDQYADLKKKYGITTQHTLVQVDADGNELGKWVGSANLVDLVGRVK